MRVAYVGGAGRLGLALAARSADVGHDVVVSDVNRTELQKIADGTVDRVEPNVGDLIKKNHIHVTTSNADAAMLAELICIIVPTPSTPTGVFSRYFVEDAARGVARGLAGRYRVINIVSTVMPGDTRYIGKVIEEESGLALGKDFGLVYSPEFVRQGSVVDDFANPDMIMIGSYDARSGAVAQRYYASVVQNSPVFYHMSLESAEVAKIGLNATVVTKMGVANELAWLCHAIPGANAQDVLGAIGLDSRVGSKYFNAGTWPGGPCFPRDTRALAAAARRNGTSTPIARQVHYTHQTQLSRLADMVEDLIRDHPRVGILGLTYKPGVDILEESQGIALAHAIDHLSDVNLHDPSQSETSLTSFIQDRDLLVLMTCWPEYKGLEEMDLSGKCVVDMWGFLEDLNCDKYVRFGKG